MTTKNTTIRRFAFSAFAVAAMGVLGVVASGDSQRTGVEPAPVAGEGESVQTANLLVPRRTRLVIRFERTAVC
ncbi:MAG: hypothetical protein KF684_03510 [Phycisphaeraceae bacterium]|nr:hypothetical protein [Phycisphaeraceae bacterium]